MKIAFTPDGWSDFIHWIETDRKKLNRLVRLIKETSRDPFKGLGEPEALRHDLSAGGPAVSTKSIALSTAWRPATANRFSKLRSAAITIDMSFSEIRR